MTITVTASPTPISPLSQGSAIASITFSASGGTGPYTWSGTGLPAGLSLSGSVLSGTPTGIGEFSVVVTATDSLSATGTYSFGLYVRPVFNSVNFNFTVTPYTPPAHNAVNFNFGGSSPPPPPSANLLVNGTVNASAALVLQISASLQVGATLTAAAEVEQFASAALAGAATLSASATVASVARRPVVFVTA